MTDDLSLRTARALHGTKVQYNDQHGWHIEIDRQLGLWAPLEEYGLTWASCAEIDAEIKERGWGWQCYTLDGNVVALISRRASTARGCVIEAIASTLPAAFALAFCRAVEAQGSAQTDQEAP